ncbi:hypothetical protein [Guyparkeria sp.]|uniref:hypothetical protein n=1 Tax=Guyparkeria sp. TaxID=2035736 RepID=UPI003970DDBB
MKTQLKMTVLATAVTALMSGGAFASGGGGHNGGGHNGGGHNGHDQEEEVITTESIANVDNTQVLLFNQVENDMVKNTAGISDSVGANSQGNIGMNVASGDLNVQDNAAALAAADASVVFGSASSNVNVNQMSFANGFSNDNVQNNAGISGSAFSGASGNIGVNVAAGSGNMQKNSLAAATGNAQEAEASADSTQLAAGNNIRNEGYVEHDYVALSSVKSRRGGGHHHEPEVVYNTNDSSLTGNAFMGASGNIGVNIAAGSGNMQSNSLSLAVACQSCPQ